MMVWKLSRKHTELGIKEIDCMTKQDVQKIIFKKCEPISSDIINIDCLEILNKMIATKEIEV